MRYTGKETSQIAFPLGGIGTGCISLAGNGAFRDIEIGGHPNKNTTAEFTHFAVKAEDESGVVDARVVQGDLQTGYMGSPERPRSTGFGFGPDRGTMAGFPHFREVVFDGEFPLARLSFSHPSFPGALVMEAFNPLIPTNEDDSSIPAAFFLFHLKNESEKTLRYTLALSCNNFFCKTKTRHRFEEHPEAKLMVLGNDLPRDTTTYGDLTIATDCAHVSCQHDWYRGSWFDNSTVFWKEFAKPGPLPDRVYHRDRNIPVYNDASDEVSDVATLAAHVTLGSGEETSIRFVLSWSSPWMSHDWQILQAGLSDEEIERRRSQKWKNYYAVLFEDSRSSALYAFRHFDRLYRETMLYHDAIFGSSLPDPVKDAVTANIAVLKSPTCLRLEDGSFYAFEGVRAHMGSCEGTCTHVWNYAYALAFLFPRLERSARRNEYTYSMQRAGGMGFRLQLPPGTPPTTHRPAADGQFGTVLRVYREFMISGDRGFLAEIWPQVKRSISFAWSPENPDRWDPDKKGLLTGCQHHTLDMELFGPNSWLSGMYLAALAAAARLALIMDEPDTAEAYRAVLHRGKKLLDEELFNGEYYCQKVDLSDRSLLKYCEGDARVYAADYWNEENGELKYQIGEGCSIDQVLGQWHADLLHLGDVFDPEKVRSALTSVFRYNFIPDMREHVNPCRIFGADDEQGTMICSYPPGRKKPLIPVPYCEETMHGFEYQAAGHMIRRGLEAEGLTCVKAVRDRYDGYRRNPWNEMECGSHYARSLSSYALLLFYSGFVYDMHLKRIGFHPLHDEAYRFFWSLDSGFGTIEKRDGRIELVLLYGQLELGCFEAETGQTAERIRRITHKTADGEKTISGQRQGIRFVFDPPLEIRAGEALRMDLSGP